jgi:hypothetical protein
VGRVGENLKKKKKKRERTIYSEVSDVSVYSGYMISILFLLLLRISGKHHLRNEGGDD